MIAYLMSGQGAQQVGMGQDLYEKYETAKKIYDLAEEITKMEVKKISFEGPEEELKQTKNTQIAIVTMQLAIIEILKENGIYQDISAGLSLGEYSALVAGNSIDNKTAMRVIQKRGELMQELCPEGDWKMAAVLGLEDSKVEDICKKVTKGFVAPANYNCKDREIVISGDREGVEEAMNISKQEGARRVVELKTSGPFHTEKLKNASIEFEKFLENEKINVPDGRVIKNIDAKEYVENDNMVEILAKHIMSPTKMAQTIEKMLEYGVDTFVEIGPGKTLTSFVKKVNKEVKCININSVETLESAISQLKKGE